MVWGDLVNVWKRPLIGVFVSHSVYEKLIHQDNRFQSYHRFYHLVRASNDVDVTIFFFSSFTFNCEQRTILGTFYDHEKGMWRTDLFPLPDVLYDRRGAGAAKSKIRVARILACLEEYGVQKINTRRYFNKWDVYLALLASPTVCQYLPATRFCNGMEDLQQFVEQYPDLYLKGVRGRKGKRVMRITLVPQLGIEYAFHQEQAESGIVSSWDELWKLIQGFFKGKPFIMQEAINLLRQEGRLVDFRAELQRNGEGNLVITGISARIGLPGSPVTIHSDAVPMEVYLRKYLKNQEETVSSWVEQIHQFLIQTYLALEATYGYFGEIGIDFGLDPQGRIWFIEPNAKSAKVSLSKAFSEDVYDQAFLNPLAFAKYLYQQRCVSPVSPRIGNPKSTPPTHKGNETTG